MLTLFGLTPQAELIADAAIAVALLIFLVVQLKMHAFLALLLISLWMGIAAGMDLPGIAQAFQEGVGAMLSSIAMVVGLGAVLGKLLEKSGGARVLADWLVRRLGSARVDWALMLAAFFIGLPVFFAVGLVLLAPVLFTIGRETRTPFLRLALSLLAGLSVAHGLVPPHPGPLAAIVLMHADLGKTLGLSLVIGFVTAVVAGPLLARLLERFVVLEPPADGVATPAAGAAPRLGWTILTLLLPVLLMLWSAAADLWLAKESGVRACADFVGHPLVALFAAVLLGCFSFGHPMRWGRGELLRLGEESLGPVAPVLLVVGAGGGFNRVLVQSGIGQAIASLTAGAHLSPVIFGWFLAGCIRVATGSATVAISTAAGILGPLAAARPEMEKTLVVLSMGAGSLMLSHVNDGGFWFVKEYFRMSVADTLRTWSVMETVVSVVALLLILLVNVILR